MECVSEQTKGQKMKIWKDFRLSSRYLTFFILSLISIINIILHNFPLLSEVTGFTSALLANSVYDIGPTVPIESFHILPYLILTFSLNYCCSRILFKYSHVRLAVFLIVVILLSVTLFTVNLFTDFKCHMAC